MAKVRRANSILFIKDSEVDRYIDLGYVQLDEKSGEIIKEGVPQEISRLKEAYVKHVAEIKELKDKIAKLESKKEETKVVKKATKKVDVE